MKDGKIRCALVGYGAALNWGRMHARWIQAVQDLELAAVCTARRRAPRAKADWPKVDTYTDVGDMLRRNDIDLVSVLTPHHTHAAIAIQCPEAGKHVLIDKPTAITSAECTAMLHVVKSARRTLGVQQPAPRWQHP
jgi:scyllo-inositol 2-dehydrogenase (NADP+)